MDTEHVFDEVRRRFGLEPRPAQVALIRRALAGQSALGIMPTGAGKSLTYQAAAALLPGTVLVISPLLSLMRDQVEKLGASLRVARLDSTLDRESSAAALASLGRGELDLLYVAPERLANERFQAALARVRVPLLAVDEAHCISAWGHDFRPDYLRLPILRAQLGEPPVLALTATATPAVQADILRDLGIPPEGVTNTGARRENLALRVEQPADREARLLELILEAPTAPTIVYVFRRADAERLAGLLQDAGLRAAPYHAGLDDVERGAVQDRFLRDELACIVATIAFGMGVDKPNVRRVIHAHAPRSLEGYWQEVGRAGRDGEPAEGVLLFDDLDLVALANLVDGRLVSSEQIRAALNESFLSRESESVIAFSPYGVAEAHDMEPQTLRTLLARLELRGVVRALTPAFDSYQVPLGADQAAVARDLGPEDARLWEALLATAKRGRTWLTLSLSAAAAWAGAPIGELRRVLRRLEDEGLTEVRASAALHRYEVLRRPDRATDLPALLAAADESVEGEHRRLAAVQAYVDERGCRVQHALRYLGDEPGQPCGLCDRCRGEPSDTARRARRAAAWRDAIGPDEVRELGALRQEGPDPIGVSRALCQLYTARSRIYRKHPAWGRLERAPFGEVLAFVEACLPAT